jgi:hypothetical protein
MGGNLRDLIIINLYQTTVTVKCFTCDYSNKILMLMEGGNFKANSHIPCHSNAAPLLFSCHDVPLRV